MANTTRIISIPDSIEPIRVLGPSDSVIRRVEQAFPKVSFFVRSNQIHMRAWSKEGDEQAVQAEKLLTDIISAAYSSPLDVQAVEHLLDQKRIGEFNLSTHEDTEAIVIETVNKSHPHNPKPDQQVEIWNKRQLPEILAYAAGRPVRPKTTGQNNYVSAINTHTITFGIGPAGTGKTYLAVAKAVQAFRARQVSKIILTRPAVEAGENLGFLPGSLNEKVDPYLRPLYDALSDMLGPERMHHYMENGLIEVAPLAYMRGRTLNDAFVILDEAQNTTRQQMKMFLTRLGFNTTMVITGDITQVDLGLPVSGLATIEQILGEVNDIAFIHLGAGDVVRHQLVGKIVEAYDNFPVSIKEHQSNGKHLN